MLVLEIHFRLSLAPYFPPYLLSHLPVLFCCFHISTASLSISSLHFSPSKSCFCRHMVNFCDKGTKTLKFTSRWASLIIDYRVYNQGDYCHRTILRFWHFAAFHLRQFILRPFNLHLSSRYLLFAMA